VKVFEKKLQQKNQTLDSDAFSNPQNRILMKWILCSSLRPVQRPNMVEGVYAGAEATVQAEYLGDGIKLKVLQINHSGGS